MVKSSKARQAEKPRTIDDDTEACLDKARQEWMQGVHKSVATAAKAHNVPYITLTCQVNGTALPKKQAHGSQVLLTKAEKDTLIEWVQYLGITGHPVSKRTLRPKIHTILKAKGMAVTDKTVSRTWIRNFLNEYKETIKLARTHGLDTKRAQAFNFTTVHHHFQLLSNLLKEHEIPWENVYNMDEKGVQLGGGRKNSQEKFFFNREDKMMYKQKGDSLNCSWSSIVSAPMEQRLSSLLLFLLAQPSLMSGSRLTMKSCMFLLFKY